MTHDHTHYPPRTLPRCRLDAFCPPRDRPQAPKKADKVLDEDDVAFKEKQVGGEDSLQANATTPSYPSCPGPGKVALARAGTLWEENDDC
jgi:hypothetical protein